MIDKLVATQIATFKYSSKGVIKTRNIAILEEDARYLKGEDLDDGNQFKSFSKENILTKIVYKDIEVDPMSFIHAVAIFDYPNAAGKVVKRYIEVVDKDSISLYGYDLNSSDWSNNTNEVCVYVTIPLDRIIGKIKYMEKADVQLPKDRE